LLSLPLTPLAHDPQLFPASASPDVGAVALCGGIIWPFIVRGLRTGRVVDPRSFPSWPPSVMKHSAGPGSRTNFLSRPRSPQRSRTGRWVPAAAGAGCSRIPILLGSSRFDRSREFDCRKAGFDLGSQCGGASRHWLSPTCWCPISFRCPSPNFLAERSVPRYAVLSQVPARPQNLTFAHCGAYGGRVSSSFYSGCHVFLLQAARAATWAVRIMSFLCR